MSDYNTYARAIISDNPIIAKYIKKYSGIDPLTQDLPLTGFGLLQDEEIDRAFSDPHAKYITYVIGNLPKFLVLSKDIEDQLETIQQYRTELEIASLDLDDQIKCHPDVDEANKCLETFRAVQDEYRRLLDVHISILELREDINDAIVKVSLMLEDHEAQWVDFRSNALKELAQELESSGVPLAEEEKVELLKQENWGELLRRVKEIELKLPKRISMDESSIEGYYALKDVLAKWASLGRRMQPNDMKAIEKFKPPKKVLKASKKQAKELLKSQAEDASKTGTEISGMESKLKANQQTLDSQPEKTKNLLSKAYEPAKIETLLETAVRTSEKSVISAG